MRNLALRQMVAFTGAVFVGLLAAQAQGQTITRNGSSVQAMFSADSDTYFASDPSLIPFGPAGPGTYPYYTPLPTMPAVPSAPSLPSPGNPFAGFVGGYTSTFTDGVTAAATSTISDSIAGTPTQTADINVTIPSWTLLEGLWGATGYAYEQLNFASDYSFTNNLNGLLASPSPNLPLYINGYVLPGSSAYAEFSGVVDYTWLSTSGTNGNGTINITGTTNLGSLDYAFLQPTGGSFGTWIPSTGSLAATPSGNGILAIDGFMWIAGDPAEINISSVPEPATLVLLNVAAVGLLGYVWRRRRRAKAFRHVAAFLGAVLVGCLAAHAQGQTITRQGSTVEASFLSQSGSYTNTDPVGLPTPANPGYPPLYPPGSPLTPATYTPPLPINPSTSPPAGGNPFAGIITGWTSTFVDTSGNNYTYAQSNIGDSIATTPSYTSDVQITIPHWQLIQGPTATGYAYEELNFGSNYLFQNNPGLLAPTPAVLPLLSISGTVQTGANAYAEVDALIDYTWFPAISGTNTASGPYTYGPPVSLGDLTYTFASPPGGGTFSQTLTAVSTLSATPSGDGMLAIDGFMWVAGDPFQINISSVPEPATLVLLGVAAVGLLGYGWRRWRRAKAFRYLAAFTAVVLIGLLAAHAQGQTITPQGSTVEAMFGSQSDAYQASDPAGLVPFGPAGSGTYTYSLPLNNMPAITASPSPPSGGNPFAGGGYSSYFNDGNGTWAASMINDSIASTPSYTSDINITIPYAQLYQATIATGYAYEQLSFGSDYLLTNNLNGLLASPTPNLPLYIWGSVQPGITTYAEFSGVVDYTWFPATGYSSLSGVYTFGPAQPLGDVSYSFLQNGGGSFSQTLTAVSTLAATPTGDGMLAIDGFMWVAGDPFDINISSVPEPATLVLLNVAAVGLLGYGWRRWRRAKA